MNLKPIRLLLVMVCAGFALATVSCRHSPAEMAPTGDPLPKVMELSWFGAPNLNSTEVKWTHDSLSFSKRSAWLQFQGKQGQVTITPSTVAWEAFWRRMNELKVWDWQEHYMNPHVMDGSVWRIELVHGKRRVSVYGRNSYPGDEDVRQGLDEPGKVYHGYVKAVEELLGRSLWEPDEL